MSNYTLFLETEARVHIIAKYITMAPMGEMAAAEGTSLRANPNLWTLYSFNLNVTSPQDMENTGAKQFGAQGEDIFVDVPLGTLIKNTETDEIITEITEKGQEVVL